jgi:hypothetical protein
VRSTTANAEVSVGVLTCLNDRRRDPWPCDQRGTMLRACWRRFPTRRHAYPIARSTQFRVPPEACARADRASNVAQRCSLPPRPRRHRARPTPHTELPPLAARRRLDRGHCSQRAAPFGRVIAVIHGDQLPAVGCDRADYPCCTEPSIRRGQPQPQLDLRIRRGRPTTVTRGYNADLQVRYSSVCTPSIQIMQTED